MSKTIRFDELRIAYNYLYQKSYETEKELWTSLYMKHKSAAKLDQIFGIGTVEISERLKHFGIILFSEKDEKTCTESLLFSIPLCIIKNTSQKDLAELVGCSRGHISKILKKNNIKGE